MIQKSKKLVSGLLSLVGVFRYNFLLDVDVSAAPLRMDMSLSVPTLTVGAGPVLTARLHAHFVFSNRKVATASRAATSNYARQAGCVWLVDGFSFLVG